jgi:hypothetical protein
VTGELVGANDFDDDGTSDLPAPKDRDAFVARFDDATVIRILESLDENDLAEFVAAVISRGDELLVCRRPAHKRHGGLWEFPGGKVELDESDEDSASRELAELPLAPARGHRGGASPPARRTSSASPCSTMIRFAGFRFTMTNVDPSGETS